MWFQHWEQELLSKYGKGWLEANGYADGVIRKMGFDGVTIGTGKDMIICKYADIR